MRVSGSEAQDSELLKPQPLVTRGPNLGKSAALTAAPQAATLLVAVVLSPYIVSRIGLTAFGFWSVIQAVLAYAQIGSGGAPYIATRLVASGNQRRDRDLVFEAFWTAVAAMVLLAVLVLCAAAALVALIPESWSMAWPDGWDWAIAGAAAAFGLLTTAKTVGSLVQGTHRWEIDAVVLTTGQLAWAAAIIAALELGFGLPGLALGALAPAAVAAIGYGSCGAWLFQGLDRPRWPGAEVRQAFRSQFFNLQVVAFVSATNAQADRLLLLPFAPLSWVGAYALGSRMATALRSFPVAAFTPLFARASAIYEAQGLAGVRNLYRLAVRIVTSVGAAGLVLLYCALYPGVLAWLGSSFAVSATAAVALGIPFALNIVTGPATALGLAAGRSDLDRDYNILGLVINLVLTVPLGIVFGPWGVVGATGVGLVLSSLWLFRRVDHWLDLALWKVLGDNPSAFRPVVLAAVVGACGIAVTVVVGSDSRSVNLGIAIVMVLLGAAVLGRGGMVDLRRARRGIS